ncbi:Outer membrane protein OmpA [Pseudomonas flavescens]|uniref:Outer membrane protein OmpA n=1 Tax=Phytopseudomonas flavescens TaxID=29435 RepID=A0A1G8EWC5_9GAMM|nr:OmpA family protein [Pseudomonas flavescens]SDH74168.1 Outer membrane protein OmpA [Pseudomonas flavescens]
MRKQVMIPALLALSIGLAACSTQPNINLEQARSSYSSLQTNPEAVKVAALETKDAGEALEKAERAFREKEDEKKVDQLAYLAEQRIELANQTIALRTTEQRLAQSASERAKARLEARDAQIAQLENSLNAKQTERGTLVTFGDVLFDLDRAELKPNAYPNIAKLAQFLQQNPDRKVIVEGYTDSTGSAEYNQGLSERRANAVRAALVRQGVGSERIVTQGYGLEYPVASNASAAGRAQNRRVEVTISNDDKPVAPRSSVGH